MIERHVAMYLRISQEKKQEGIETLDNHREILTDFCKRNNWTWEEYGEVVSGGSSDMDKRPQLLRLMNDIEKFDGILVIELSRLSRNGLISETILQSCIDYHKYIFTPYQTLDVANSETDRTMYRFGSLIASQEHATIGRRSRDNKIQMTRKGLWVAGEAPYGYTIDKATKKLVVVEHEADVVRGIFDLHKEGKGIQVIADTLNEEGIRPKRHTPTNPTVWKGGSVKKILCNPAYKGTVVFQEKKRIKKGDKWTHEVIQTITVDNAHPPIIDPIEFELTNVEREKRGRSKPSKIAPTILRDLVYCGICGKKLPFALEKNGKVTLRYCGGINTDGSKCSNSGMYVEPLEKAVVEQIKKYEDGLREELARLEYHDTSTVEQQLARRMDNVQQQLEKNTLKRNNLMDMALEGLFSREQVVAKQAELEQEKFHLETTLEEIKGQMQNLDTEPMIARIEGILDMLTNLEEYQSLLKRIIYKIYFTRDIPIEIKSLSPMNPQRKHFPFHFEIEYLE